MGLEQRFGRTEAIPTDHALEFFRDYVGTIIAKEARSETRQLSTKPVNTPVGSPRNATKLTPNSWRCIANRPCPAIQGADSSVKCNTLGFNERGWNVAGC